MSAASPKNLELASADEYSFSARQPIYRGRGSGVSVAAPEPDMEPGPSAGCDASLLLLVRDGKISAFTELFQRYRDLATYVARAESDNASEVDDVVGEAFAAVFRALSLGGGPSDSFRGYLLTLVRRMAHRRNIQARRTVLLSDVRRNFSENAYVDTFLDAVESSSLTEAFQSLPLRWRAVLWYGEVEGLKPAAIAPLMGLSPNGVSSLLIRARKALREAYFQINVAEVPVDSCAQVSRQLGKFAVDGDMAGHQRIRHHVKLCPKCAVALTTSREMRRFVKGAGRPVTAESFEAKPAQSVGGNQCKTPQ